MAKKLDRSAIARKIWRTRRKNAKLAAAKAAKRKIAASKRKYTRQAPDLSHTLVDRTIPEIPYERVDQLSVTKTAYTKEQVKELGLFAVTEDGEKFHFLKVRNRVVPQKIVHALRHLSE